METAIKTLEEKRRLEAITQGNEIQKAYDYLYVRTFGDNSIM